MAPRRWIAALLAAGLFCAVVATTPAAAPGETTELNSASGGDFVLEASVTGIGIVVARPDTWRLGTLERQAAPVGTGPVGHVVHWESAWGRPGGATLPAPALWTPIRGAWYCLLSRAGSYPPGAALTLDVVDYAGGAIRALSATPVDLQTTALGVWTEVPLAGNTSVAPGEMLAFRVTPAGGPEGDLAIDAAFEVQTGVRRPARTPWMFLPDLFRGY